MGCGASGGRRQTASGNANEDHAFFDLSSAAQPSEAKLESVDDLLPTDAKTMVDELMAEIEAEEGSNEPKLPTEAKTMVDEVMAEIEAEEVSNEPKPILPDEALAARETVKEALAAAIEIEATQKEAAKVAVQAQAAAAVLRESASASSDSAAKRQGLPPVSVREEREDGCILWNVHLAKREPGDKYDFTLASGKAEFQKRERSRDETNKYLDSSGHGPEILTVKCINEGGLMNKWNIAHSEADVSVEDHIIAVNGQTTIKSMQEEMANCPAISMKICRFPEHFDVELEKGEKKLGFKFEKPSNENMFELRITKVSKDGILADCNAREIARGRWHCVVQSGMTIEAVNGREADAAKMAEELRRCDVARLRIRRSKPMMPELPVYGTWRYLEEVSDIVKSTTIHDTSGKHFPDKPKRDAGAGSGGGMGLSDSNTQRGPTVNGHSKGSAGFEVELQRLERKLD